MAELKSHTARFFEVIMRTQETQEDGTVKMVKKTIVVDAVSFADAEAKAIREMAQYVNDIEVININPAQYGEVFTSDIAKDDRFYKCKLSLISIDERTSKEKRIKVVYLVQAGSTNTAQSYIDNEIMGGSLIDFEITSITGTPIIDAFFYDGEKANEANKE